METITWVFVRARPECLEARDALDLLVILNQGRSVDNLAELLRITSHAEVEYERLCRYRRVINMVMTGDLEKDTADIAMA